MDNNNEKFSYNADDGPDVDELIRELRKEKNKRNSRIESVSDADGDISNDVPQTSSATLAEEEHMPEILSSKNKAKESATKRRFSIQKNNPDIEGKRHLLRDSEMLIYDSELDEIDYYDPEDLPEPRDYLPIRFSRCGRLGIARGVMYGLFIICISVVLAVMCWLFACDVLALNKADSTAVVTVTEYVPVDEADRYDEDGREITADIDQVSTALKSAGVIEYKWLFKLFARIASASVKIDPGVYQISTRLDYRAIVTSLQSGSGELVTVTVTIPEGYTMDQIFALLEENNVSTAEKLYDAAANTQYDYSWLDADTLGDPNRLEGFLFPDTYEFYQGESSKTAINRFLKNFNNRFDEDMIQQAKELGFSVREIVTLASLVEKEAGDSDGERENVSSVIHNRLNASMPLQLDSTINYINNSSTFQFTAADLETDSPYNTYLYSGLPAGPICNPGLAALKAALNPASTSYYYFAIDAETGETHFFKNGSDFTSFVDSQNYSNLD